MVEKRCIDTHRHTHTQTHTHTDYKAIYGTLKKKKKNMLRVWRGVNTSSRGKKKASISDDIKLLLLYKSGLLIKTFFLANVLIA